MRKQRLIDLPYDLPTLAIFGTLFAAAIFAILRGGAQGGTQAGIALFLGAGFVLWRWLAWRRRFLDSILGYTQHGVAISAAPGFTLPPAQSAQVVVDIGKAIEDTIIWWLWKRDPMKSAHYKLRISGNQAEKQVRDAFDGAVLVLSKLRFAWHGSAPYLTRQASGMRRGRTMGVTWQTGQSFPVYIVQHEASHVILAALGVPSSEHHAVMRAEEPP